MTSLIRRLVSQHKNRFVADDFDLDLTYITSNVVAMSWPAPSSGLEALYRNPMGEVAKMLNTYHSGHYRVYNLCSEKAYAPGKFAGGDVVSYPMDDHEVPTLPMLFAFVRDAKAYLAQHDSNVVAVHCKAGKGRTGICIAALLLSLGTAHTWSAALAHFAIRRTDNCVGVTIASQRRWVQYYDAIKHHSAVPPPCAIRLRSVRISKLPSKYANRVIIVIQQRNHHEQLESAEIRPGSTTLDVEGDRQVPPAPQTVVVANLPPPAACNSSMFGSFMCAGTPSVAATDTLPGTPAPERAPSRTGGDSQFGAAAEAEHSQVYIPAHVPAAAAASAPPSARNRRQSLGRQVFVGQGWRLSHMPGEDLILDFDCEQDPEEWRICGDFKVQVFLDNISRSRSLFWAWHNTTFMAGSQSVLAREQLDKVHKSMPPDISMSLCWEPGQGHMYPLAAAAPTPLQREARSDSVMQSGELSGPISQRSSLGQRPPMTSRFVELADIGSKGKAPQRRRKSRSAGESPPDSRPSTATLSRPSNALTPPNVLVPPTAPPPATAQQAPLPLPPVQQPPLPPLRTQQLSASPFVRDASLNLHASVCDMPAERQSSQGGDLLERQTTDTTQQDMSLMDRLDESWMGGGSSFMSSSGTVSSRRRPPLPPAPPPDATATVALRRSLVHAPLHSTSAFKPQTTRRSTLDMPYVTQSQRRGSARHHSGRHARKLSTVESEPLSAGTVGSAMAADIAEAMEEHPVALSAALPVRNAAGVCAPSGATSGTATQAGSFCANAASPFTATRTQSRDHGSNSHGQHAFAVSPRQAHAHWHSGGGGWQDDNSGLLHAGMRSHSVIEPGATATVHHSSPLRRSNVSAASNPAAMPPPPPPRRRLSQSFAHHDWELDDATAQMPEATRAVMSRLMRQRRAAEERWRSGQSHRWGAQPSDGSSVGSGVVSEHARSATWGGQPHVPQLPHPLPPGPVPLVATLQEAQQGSNAHAPAGGDAAPAPLQHTPDTAPGQAPPRPKTPLVRGQLMPALPVARLPQRQMAVERRDRSGAQSSSSGRQTRDLSAESSQGEAPAQPAAAARACMPSLAQSMAPPAHAAALAGAIAPEHAPLGIAPESLAERLRLLAASQQQQQHTVHRRRATPKGAQWRQPSAPEPLRARPENVQAAQSEDGPVSQRGSGASMSQGSVGLSDTARIPDKPPAPPVADNSEIATHSAKQS